ncbi:MAG: complex I NDUFA9 subunit family protein [Pseudomonadota bacterium]|nr:complex I NDUFA9 subunit family protein [Pseudomonadota bacterium]
MKQIFKSNSPTAVVFGGSGFIGRYIVHRLVRSGYKVRVAVRKPNEALFLKTYGEVGQVEILACSVLDVESVQSCLQGSSIVVNCVAGSLSETKLKNFEKYYIFGPEIIAKSASSSDVKKLIHISSIGVHPSSISMYSRTKAKGERRVLKHFPGAIILRPSLVFGHEDMFFNRFASMATFSPFIPIVGRNTKFQPVYVNNIADAVARAVSTTGVEGVYELGGPEILTYEELMKKMLKIIRRKRIIFPLPIFFAKSLAFGFSVIKSLTAGFVQPPITLDNIKQLEKDNLVSGSVKSFSDLDISPDSLDSVLPNYLYRYRPHGQYTETTESARR